MSTAGAEKRHVVQLDWSAENGVVTVTPRDQDRFSIQMRRAVAILQQANQAKAFGEQFRLLLRVLATWLKDRDDVRVAYITHRDGALSFLVVRTKVEYDEAFEDALSDLDFDIANDADLDLIKINAMALPDASDSAIDAFLDSEFTLSYAGAHGQGT